MKAPFFARHKAKARVYVSLHQFVESDWKTLDVTSSLRNYWRGRDSTGVLFLDKRAAVKPDIVGSNEFLPFRPGVFECVFYDPPSVARGRGVFVGSSMEFRYGYWRKKADFKANLHAVDEEAFRVLTPNGRLLLKYTDGPGMILRYEKVVAELSNFVIEKEERRPSRSGNPRTRVIFTWLGRRLEMR